MKWFLIYFRQKSLNSIHNCNQYLIRYEIEVLFYKSFDYNAIQYLSLHSFNRFCVESLNGFYLFIGFIRKTKSFVILIRPLIRIDSNINLVTIDMKIEIDFRIIDDISYSMVSKQIQTSNIFEYRMYY